MSNNFHLQLYRGTTAQNDAYTGLSGEVTVDTTLSKLRLHDGSTAGGVEIGGMPVGSIIPYAGTTIPAGYLLCDGSAISRTTYSALFAAIGTTYGAGDGNSTFNIPKTRRVITETYSSGTEWYRVYSDGWCEQGGVITINTTTNTGTRITFPRSFANTNYQRIISGVEFSNNTTDYVPVASIASNSTIDENGFSVVRWYAQGGGTGIQSPGNVYWRASGYTIGYVSNKDIIKYNV